MININFIDFIAGWIGGCSGLLVGHPLDTLKVRQQIHRTGFIESIIKTFKYEGVRGFYKGASFPMLMIGPSNAILFGVYGNFMRMTAGGDGVDRITMDDPHWRLRSLLGGTVAGAVQVTATTPVELVKTLLQVQTQHKAEWKTDFETEYKGVWDCVKKVYQLRGITGLYRGYVAMMYRDCSTSGIYTLSYEVILSWNYPIDILNTTLSKQIIAGGMAGIFSWMPVVPFDVVKSRIQADNPYYPKYKSMMHCFYLSYKEEGIYIFFKGSTALYIRAFNANAAVFVMYETTHKVYRKLTAD